MSIKKHLNAFTVNPAIAMLQSPESNSYIITPNKHQR